MQQKTIKILAIFLFLISVTYYLFTATNLKKILKIKSEKKEDEIIEQDYNSSNGGSIKIPTNPAITGTQIKVTGNINKGDKGAAVMHLQATLGGLVIDGGFGPATEARLFETLGKKQLTPKEWFDYCFVNPFMKYIDTKKVHTYNQQIEAKEGSFINNVWLEHICIISGLRPISGYLKPDGDLRKIIEDFAPYFKNNDINGNLLTNQIIRKKYII